MYQNEFYDKVLKEVECHPANAFLDRPKNFGDSIILHFKNGPQANCHLAIEFVNQNSFYDSAGNFVSQLGAMACGVGWPTYSNINFDLAKTRVDLYSLVLNLAQKLNDEFRGVSCFQILKSKEELDLEAERKINNEQFKLATQLVKDNLKGMRVGKFLTC